jgi:predicted nucleic acid-binding protein
MNSLFLDTNFFLDILDKSRQRHSQANNILIKLLENSVILYTSSDIISTISYFLQKRLSIKDTVLNIGYIVKSVQVLSSTNQDFLELNRLILKNYTDSKIDYEDCMQLFLANKYKIDAILTSDKRFCEGFIKLFNVRLLSLDDIAILKLK